MERPLEKSTFSRYAVPIVVAVFLTHCQKTPMTIPSLETRALVMDAETLSAAETETDSGMETDAESDLVPVRRLELPMMPGRNVWYASPRNRNEHRLIAHLHGQCAPPVYSCGQWTDAGTERGYLVCPTGNEHCTSPMGPAMWDESFALMDQDLERAIAVASRHEGDGGISRDDAVMTGFSRGGWAAIEVVRMHPGRWPHLIIVEADVTITKNILDQAKVESVVMIAAENGTELVGERKSVDALKAAGFRAELLVMPHSWHMYSDDIDDIMRRALAFVLGE